jgi:hypothetical protein
MIPYRMGSLQQSSTPLNTPRRTKTFKARCVLDVTLAKKAVAAASVSFSEFYVEIQLTSKMPMTTSGGLPTRLTKLSLEAPKGLGAPKARRPTSLGSRGVPEARRIRILGVG